MATKSTDDSEAVMRTAIEAFDDRDFDAMAAVHADDVVVHENGETITGYDAVEEHMAEALQALGDPAFTVTETVADGDTVACRYSNAGTSDGEQVEGSALALARIEDGFIVEVHVQSEFEVDEVAPPTDREAENVALVRALYEAAADGEFDVDAFLAPLADDVEWVEPEGSPVGGLHRGHDGVGTIMETMGTDFEAFEVVPERFIADGDAVAVPVTERFTIDGEQVDVRAVHLYDVEDGEITRMENF
jgi:ketosteroid isomerase-like protein